MKRNLNYCLGSYVLLFLCKTLSKTGNHLYFASTYVALRSAELPQRHNLKCVSGYPLFDESVCIFVSLGVIVKLQPAIEMVENLSL